MSIRLPVALTAVYQRMGQYVHTVVYRSELRPTTFAAPRYALLLCWPQKQSWLRVRASLEGAAPYEFFDSPQGLDRVCREFGSSRELIRPPGQPDFFNQHEVRVGGVNHDTAVRLEFTIDTDARSFLQAIQENGGAGELVTMIRLCAFTALAGNLQAEEGEITLVLRPVQRLRAYPGSVAVDLGNTSSSIACLPQGRDSTRDLRVLRGESESGRLMADAMPALSQLRIDEVLTWDTEPNVANKPTPHTRRLPSLPTDDLPQAIRWVIDRVAATGTRGLILGAKRLVAGPRSEEPRKLLVLHNRQYNAPPTKQEEQIDVVNRLPAELLACRLLQQFTRAAVNDDGMLAGWPRHLALTYPTTYSPAEIDRLSRTIYRAWLRLHFKGQRPRADGEGPRRAADAIDPELERCAAELQRRLASCSGGSAYEDPLIRLKLDEASAAAFFFLYRKLDDMPGGLETFRYFYPDGMNLLLYDCGGGTTDIALVSARLDPSKTAWLHLDVRGRTGVRHFGGDDITLAVCRLLKAKLARELAPLRGLRGCPNPPPAPPAGTTLDARLQLRDKVQEFLRGMDKFDREPEPLVPTRWDNQLVDPAEAQRRRENKNALWNWGEQLKYHLAGAESATLANVGVKLGPKQSSLADALLRDCQNDPVALKDLADKLEKVVVHRWEVDSLIGAVIARSVRNCNRLIRDALRPTTDNADALASAVHWVVLSGNGSRYPLIPEMLRDRLTVFGLEQKEQFLHDPDNLKHAVAKGAALALATRHGQGTWHIEFDADLSECLPCDIGYKDRRIGDQRILFAQQQRYTQLTPQAVPLAALARDAGEQPQQLFEFTLWRRFPGDGDDAEQAGPDEPQLEHGWSPYGTYHFEDGIRGDLTISYDPETHEFAVVDTAGGQGRLLQDETEATYLAPPQRGDW